MITFIFESFNFFSGLRNRKWGSEKGKKEREKKEKK